MRREEPAGEVDDPVPEGFRGEDLGAAAEAGDPAGDLVEAVEGHLVLDPPVGERGDPLAGVMVRVDDQRRELRREAEPDLVAPGADEDPPGAGEKGV